MALILRGPNENDEHIFLEGRESPHWYRFIWKPGVKFQEMLTIKKNEAIGIDLAPDRAPHTMLYGFLVTKLLAELVSDINEMITFVSVEKVEFVIQKLLVDPYHLKEIDLIFF